MKQLEDTLREIEKEMRALDLWEADQPPLQNLQSPMPFCYDTLRLPQWLQWVFLPRCHQMIKTRDGIPEDSDIHTIAEYYFTDAGIEASNLLICVKRFDDLISEWNSPQGHRH